MLDRHLRSERAPNGTDHLQPFGETGRRVARVGQGTWMIERDPHAALAALRLGITLGATHVDTAEIYGDGAAEELVGRALRGMRERAFLASKVNPAHASRAGVQRACEASLRRLKTDYLDLYLLHWVAPHPLEETIAGFEDLVAAGKILYWGVSNFDEHKLEEALRIAGPGRIACNQVKHHLEDRTIETGLVPLCERYGIALVGYSPFGAGRFATRRPAALAALAEVAAAVDATPRQTALAFLLHTSRGFTIPKAAQLEHAAENAAAAHLRLDSAAIERLDRAFPIAALQSEADQAREAPGDPCAARCL